MYKVDLSEVEVSGGDWLPGGGDYNVEVTDVVYHPREGSTSPRLEVSFVEVLENGELGNRIHTDTFWLSDPADIAAYPQIKQKISQKIPLNDREKETNSNLQRLKEFTDALFNMDYKGELNTDEMIGKRCHIVLGRREAKDGKWYAFMPKFRFAEPYGRKAYTYDPDNQYHNLVKKENPMNMGIPAQMPSGRPVTDPGRGTVMYTPESAPNLNAAAGKQEKLPWEP